MCFLINDLCCSSTPLVNESVTGARASGFRQTGAESVQSGRLIRFLFHLVYDWAASVTQVRGNFASGDSQLVDEDDRKLCQQASQRRCLSPQFKRQESE